MRRLAPQTARWFQHRIPRLSSRFLLPATSQQCRTVRKARSPAPAALGENEKGVTIRTFEQDFLRSKDRKEVDPNRDDTDKQAEETYAELKQLDEELMQMEAENPFEPDSDFMKSLPEDQRARLLEQMRDIDEAEKPQDGAEVYQASKEPVEEPPPKKFIEKVTLQVPKQYQVLVNKFNSCLQKTSSDERPPTVADELWIWYNRCKHTVPYFLSSIPRSAWDTLWDLQNETPAVSVRATRLKVLAEDILVTEGTLNPTQSLAYIECLDLGGDRLKAIQTWKACEIDLEEPIEIVTQYLSLGLRLYSANGDLKEAKKIARDLFRRQGISDYRSVKPIILAQSKVQGEVGAKQAWTSYLQMKQGLGKAMKMEDYDELSLGFLETGRPDLAVAVFKDMMLSQQESPHSSESLYRTALGHVGKMQSSAIKESDLTKLSLGALTVLPRRFENKYFYGSWLKKLIGMRELEAAAMVIDLMVARGVRPDARYLNGMIAAWIQAGNASSRAKAEAMGWAMIRARIDFVSQRTVNRSQFEIGDPSSIDDIKNFTIPPPSVRRDVPRATVETFSLLTQFYSRRNMDNVVEHLLYCLRLADIPPNSYVMNHLLYAQLRKHDLKAVTRTYQTMSPPVQPDLETFACFWDCSKLSFNKLKEDVAPTDFPTPRSVYRGMVNWLTQLTPKTRETAKAQFSKELYNQIILCFCLSRDVQGTLVALHALKAIFNIGPDENTASMVVHRIARLLPVDYSKLPSMTSKSRRRLRRAGGNPEYKTNLAKVAQVLETIHEGRVYAFAVRGLVLEDCEPHVQEEQVLGDLTDLGMTTLWKVVTATDKQSSLRRRFKEAAEEMGCEIEWFEEALKSTEKLIEEGAV
jgi:tetratricopeptide (TPR) repeat protein